MPGWRPDPKGGFIRIPPPPEPEPKPEPLPYGWKVDPDGTGLVRIPDEQLPPPFRPGYWCKIVSLSQDIDKNGLIVEILDTRPDPDLRAVEIRCASLRANPRIRSSRRPRARLTIPAAREQV